MPKIPKEASAKRDGVINPQNYNLAIAMRDYQESVTS